LKDTLDLFFELSNEDRLRILLELQNSSSKLTQLSNALKLPNQEVSRQLARLVALELIYKDSRGSYNLTPYAEHLIELIPGFEFMSKNRGYFRTHTTNNLPLEFRLRIGELSKCTPLEDVMTGLYSVQKMTCEALEYTWIMQEQGNVNIAECLEEAIQRGAECREILPNGIIPSEHYARYIGGWGPDHPMRKSNCERRYIDRLPVAVIMSEKEVPQVIFPTVEGRFDYSGFRANDKAAHKWCMDVYQYCWGISSRKIPERILELYNK
jgi:predicted transcriptional regulator